ncbi:MAG: Crp/Fnr family transcriptional regulator [Cyanobacteria bacterium P01_F01_bin.150]
MVHSLISDSSLLTSTVGLRQSLEQLYAERPLYPFDSGQEIELLPDDIWIVARGIVQLGTLYDTGDESLLGLACSSSPFGLPLTSIRPYQAIALTHIDLIKVTLDEIQASTALTHSLFPHLSRRLAQSEAMAAMAGYRRVEDRLKHLLVLLSQEIGQVTEAGVRLNIRLTHQQLANAIGTTRVTITRLLSLLRQERWLTIDRQRHILLLKSCYGANFWGEKVGKRLGSI